MKTSVAALLALTLFAALAPDARADFSGDYALTPPPGGLSTANNTSAGAWLFTLHQGGAANGSLDTTNAPASFNIQAVAIGTFNSITSTLAYANVPEAGTITFDYDFTNVQLGTGGSANFTYTQNSTPIVFSGNATGSGSWTVSQGDDIGFSVFAQGGTAVGLGFPEQTQSVVTISNFAFAPTPVPEPSEFALGAGVLALGVALARRRLRTA